MFKWLLSNPGIEPELDIEQMDSALTREVSAILARAGVATFHKTLPRLRAEIDRARRYQRPLTLALIGDARAGGGHAVPGAAIDGAASLLGPGSPLIPVLLAPVLAEVSRGIDIVTYASTLAQCVVMMPEAGSKQAGNALKRMSDLCAARVHVPVRARQATFPHDGLTLEELVRKAGSAFEVPAAATNGASTAAHPLSA